MKREMKLQENEQTEVENDTRVRESPKRKKKKKMQEIIPYKVPLTGERKLNPLEEKMNTKEQESEEEEAK